jgi:uncharacterized protein YdhG (YjbR/CyaY superfamily)
MKTHQAGARTGEEHEKMKTEVKSVDEYIASQPDGVQSVLNRVRSTIRKAMLGAEETISYKIPAYKLDGNRVLFFAGWKQHYSLYPATARVIEAFKADLAPYEVSQGTIRFPLSEPVPVKLIGRIAKFRAKEVSDSKAKAAAPRRRQAPGRGNLAAETSCCAAGEKNL